ncbi:putative Tigger transposable element-derived protein 1-like 221 [Homarus americanus]|uniref:Putative Tigger transposable element-derived protein 1-like 221 n=1 Tax=Homarus americanus TaxID=6706 RepID=A0A8J5JRL3_HOMAM|nr:putative Tigger transposable element-derived protein 1-like 221 [Homarus americanus]
MQKERITVLFATNASGTSVNRDILSLAKQAGFDELESEDIEDVLASHIEELTNEDLQQLTEHSPVEDEEEPQ